MSTCADFPRCTGTCAKGLDCVSQRACTEALQNAKRVLGADFSRLRTILCEENITLHRGETVMTLVTKLMNQLAGLPKEHLSLLLNDHIGPRTFWEAAFDALEAT